MPTKGDSRCARRAKSAPLPTLRGIPVDRNPLYVCGFGAENAVETDVTQRAEHGGDMAVRQGTAHDDALLVGRLGGELQRYILCSCTGCIGAVAYTIIDLDAAKRATAWQIEWTPSLVLALSS